LTVQHATWFELNRFPHSYAYAPHQCTLSHANSHTTSHHSAPLDSPDSFIPHHLHGWNQPCFHCVFTALTVEHTTWFQLSHFPHSHTYTTSHHFTPPHATCTSAYFPTPTLTPPHTTPHHLICPIRSSHTTCTAGTNPVFIALTVEHATWFYPDRFPHSYPYTPYQRMLSHTNSHTTSHHSTPVDLSNLDIPHHLHRGNQSRFHSQDNNLVSP
jgi:hypothetical protein